MQAIPKINDKVFSLSRIASLKISSHLSNQITFDLMSCGNEPHLFSNLIGAHYLNGDVSAALENQFKIKGLRLDFLI